MSTVQIHKECSKALKKGQIEEISWFEEIDKLFGLAVGETDKYYPTDTANLTPDQHGLVERIESMFSLTDVPGSTQKFVDSVSTKERQILCGSAYYRHYEFIFIYSYDKDFKLTVIVTFTKTSTFLRSYFYNHNATYNYDYDNNTHNKRYSDHQLNAFEADWDKDKQKFNNYMMCRQFERILAFYELLQLKEQIKIN